MILGHNEIHNRLAKGEVFRKDTCDPGCIKEASYALRVADDGLMLDGKRYKPGIESIKSDIIIQPGKIAILSTMERINMPSNLLGKIGIRFDYACQGLTGLMGIQVDPFYGWGHDDVRLYIRVANLGNNAITIPLYAEAFTFELHLVSGYVPVPKKPRDSMWLRIQDTLSEQATKLDERLESETKSIRDYLQQVVMFGIFLVAVTILGVAIATILSVADSSDVDVPEWITSSWWIALLVTVGLAIVVTV